MGRMRDLVRIYSSKRPHGVKRDGVSVSDLDDALDYYDGYADRDRTVLEEALVKRYAVRLKKGEADSSGNTLDSYEAVDVADNIRQGRNELVLSRFYRRLVNTSANLFTEKTQRYAYLDEAGNALEDAEEAISAGREAGDYSRSMIRADRLSLALGSAVLYVYYQDGLRYQAIAPQSLTPLYSPEIDDGGTMRMVDATAPDEATGWVIRLGVSPEDARKSLYVAYIGESDEYPQGRCVQFAAENAEKIPNVGELGAYDFVNPAGEICNPLTVVRQSLTEQDAAHVPEYPLAIFYGSDAGTDSSLLPTTGISLFRDALELDMAWSRLCMTALKSARGVYILKDERMQALPENPDEGIVLLRSGQDLTTAGVSAVNSKDAGEVIRGIQATIAESWNVPAHEVVTGTSAPESGVALFLRNQPRIRFRQERERLNAASVARVFDVERALLYAVEGTEVIPWSTRQTWSAGEWQIPVTDKERIEALKLALDAKLIDYLEFVRQYHRLATIDEARDLLENMAERSADIPQIPQAPGSQQAQPASARQAALQRLRGGAA